MSSIKKNFLYNTIFQMLSMIVPIVITPYISRVLEPNGMGRYSYAYSITNYYMMFIILGLNNYGNREISKHKNSRVDLSYTFVSIYIAQLILGAVVSFVYLIYCFFVSHDKMISAMLAFFVIGAMIDINWALQGLEKFKIIALRNFIIKIISMCSIFLLVKSKSHIHIYCIIMSLSSFISQLSCWPIILKEIDFVKPRLKDIIYHLQNNAIFFLTVLSVSIFKVMDKIMLGLLSNKNEVGYYEAAERIIQIPTILVVSLGTVMLPRITNMISKGFVKIDKYLENSILFAMSTSSAICFGIMGISKEFVPLFYGENYDKCIILYLILLPACLFMAFANVLRSQYMLPNNIDKPFIISGFLGAGLNLIINLVLIPRMQSVGAAIGTLVAEISICVYQSFSLKKYIDIKKYVVLSLPFCISGVGMFIVLFVLNIDVWNLPLIILILIKIILGAVIYVLLLTLNIYILYKLNGGMFININTLIRDRIN